MNPLSCCMPKPEIDLDTTIVVKDSCQCCYPFNSTCFTFTRRRSKDPDEDEKIRKLAEQVLQQEHILHKRRRRKHHSSKISSQGLEPRPLEPKSNVLPLN